MGNPIERQEALDALRTCYDTNLIVLDNGDELIHYGDAVGAIEALPSAQPVVISKSENTTECEDTVPRTSVEYICRKNTVSTNPYEHKYHDKFIQFMDDPEISDFGRWQHSNGFNTALVAVQSDLDKVPSVTPKQPGWIPWDSGGFPEESGTYTVTAYDGATKRVTYAKYQKRLKRWELTGSRAYWKVLAWQPLPTPYREGGQE